MIAEELGLERKTSRHRLPSAAVCILQAVDDVPTSALVWGTWAPETVTVIAGKRPARTCISM